MTSTTNLARTAAALRKLDEVVRSGDAVETVAQSKRWERDLDAAEEALCDAFADDTAAFNDRETARAACRGIGLASLCEPSEWLRGLVARYESAVRS